MIQKKKLNIDDPNGPHRNKSLKNLKGEKWSEIPFLEGYYHISNYGRVKSLPRYIEIYFPNRKRSMGYYTKEKILAIQVHQKWNSIIDKPYYECTVAIHFEGSEKKYMIPRLVYHAFVQEIDFETDGLMVMHKDEDELNNYYTNLVAGPRSAVTQKAYDKKRHISPFALKNKRELKRISKRAGITRQKPVIQFSLQKKRIKRFESIKEASLYVGVPESNIVSMLKGRITTAGGFLWAYDLHRI